MTIQIESGPLPRIGGERTEAARQWRRAARRVASGAVFALTAALAMPASALSITSGQYWLGPRNVGVQSYTPTTAIAVFGLDVSNTQPETFGCASNLLYIDLSQPYGKPALEIVMRGSLTRVDFTKDANNLCWVYLVQG